MVKKIEREPIMKKRWLLALVFAYLFYTESGFAVDFDILSYQGDLNIHADNTAILRKQLPTALEMIIMVS